MAPCVCSMAECSTAAAGISYGCSEKGWWCGCGLLRDSDARRIECQSKTRTEFSAATVGVDRINKVRSENGEVGSERRAFAACAKRAYTGAMRTAKKIRYRLEWRK